MKKLQLCLIAGFLFVLSAALEGAEPKPAEKAAAPKADNESAIKEKEEILKRNQIDDTDTLAIPFDDSEVEDEEEINRIEGKKVFNLPGPR